MAAAARPGPSDARDARVPCPLCGGLIHPIAGKCKHCKADLTEYRAARPAASAPLPALNHASGAAGNVPSGPAAVAHAVAMPLAAQTVLPPQPTGRTQTAQSARSAWRSWPVMVIVVATLAIVAAVAIMVWPARAGRDAKRALQPPPAPERMDTQTPPVAPKLDPPQAPHAAPVDPWSTPHAPPSPAPPKTDPPPDPSAQADPSSADDDHDSDLFDPFTPAPGARTLGRGGALSSFGGALGLAMTARLCRKLVQCGTSDDTLKPLCDAISGLPSDPPPGCPAAERCLRHIDALGCTSQPDALQMGMLLMRFRDCAEAARC